MQCFFSCVAYISIAAIQAAQDKRQGHNRTLPIASHIVPDAVQDLDNLLRYVVCADSPVSSYTQIQTDVLKCCILVCLMHVAV